MSAQEILGILGLVLIIVGGVWGVIKMLLVRDRKSVDDRANEAARLNEDARAAIWRRLDELRKEMGDMKVEQGVLRERVRSMPDHDALREKFREMEEQLDKKFDHLFKQFQEAFALATTKFRCPHDTDRPGAATDLG